MAVIPHWKTSFTSMRTAVRGQQLGITSLGLVNFLLSLLSPWVRRDNCLLCSSPWGRVARLRISQGSATFAPAVFVQASAGFVSLCVSHRSQCYRALQKPPWVLPFVNSENPWGRMSSPNQAPARSKGLAVGSGQAYPGASVWGPSASLAKSALEFATRMDFQKLSRPLHLCFLASLPSKVPHRRVCKLSECLKWILRAAGWAENGCDQCVFSCHLLSFRITSACPCFTPE